MWICTRVLHLFFTREIYLVDLYPRCAPQLVRESVLEGIHPCFGPFLAIPMSDNESCCSSETDICEFLSGFPPEELTDELLAYAAKKYCKPDDKPRKAVTTKYDDPARRFELERRLRSLRMEEDEAFDHFYSEKFEKLRDELTDTGRELDHELLVYLILNALPPSWSTFVDRVVARGLDVVPHDYLLLEIESEEENRERLRVQRMLEKL